MLNKQGGANLGMFTRNQNGSYERQVVWNFVGRSKSGMRHVPALNHGGIWCVVGDFNTIYRKEERMDRSRGSQQR